MISSDSLRLQLIHLYGHTYTDLEAANDLFVNVSFEVLRPYFLAHFRDLRPNENATPLDPAAVMRDPRFENLAEYRRMVLQRNALPAYARATQDVTRLLRAIEREMEQLE